MPGTEREHGSALELTDQWEVGSTCMGWQKPNDETLSSSLENKHPSETGRPRYPKPPSNSDIKALPSAWPWAGPTVGAQKKSSHRVAKPGGLSCMNLEGALDLPKVIQQGRC